MLTKARNTLASIEESVERLANAGDQAAGGLGDVLGDLRPALQDAAIQVHKTCIRVQRAADEHARTARLVQDVIEAMIWGAALGLAIYYTREIVKSVWDLSHE